MNTTCSKFEEFEVRPLFQVARAAMNDPQYGPDALTREGVAMLLDIIESRVFPELPRRRPRAAKRK